MKLSLFPLLAFLSLPATGAVVAPILYTDSSKITRDPAYTNPANQTTSATETEVDDEGFAVVRQSATALIQTSNTVDRPQGGGSRSMTSTHRFDSLQRQRLLPTEDGFRFDATTDISAGIDSKLSISSYGNFLFVIVDEETNTFETNRLFRFVVDQPMHLLIHLSGLTTTSDFKGMFNNILLRGGAFRPFVDSIYQFTVTAYQANEQTTFGGSGSKLGIDYELSGTANGTGIDLLMKLSPTVEGTAPEAQLSWLVRSQIRPLIGPGFASWNRQTEASASIRESLIVRPIPEPSTPLLIAISTIALLIRRYRCLPIDPRHGRY